MRGYDANYVPGWDCHGLPIEWKIEEQYRAKGKNKDEVPVNEFRKECRDFAAHWVGVQTEEFRRLGVEGDFKDPYLTMALRRRGGDRRRTPEIRHVGPALSRLQADHVVGGERTALAEAEVEYQEHESDTVWVKFPIVRSSEPGEPLGPARRFARRRSARMPEEQTVLSASCRALRSSSGRRPPGRSPATGRSPFADRIAYGLYEVTAPDDAENPRWAEGRAVSPGRRSGRRRLRQGACSRGRLSPRAGRSGSAISHARLPHPLRRFGGGYDFAVPLLDGDHVTDDAGTGFVHTAPGHGREDFDAWMDMRRDLEKRGIDTTIPFTVDDDGFYTKDAPGFGPDAPRGRRASSTTRARRATPTSASSLR